MPRIVLLAHGAGSTADTASRLLAPAFPEGATVLAVDARGHVRQIVDRLAQAATGHEVLLAAGISLGAHAVAQWSIEGGHARALLLAMPAWTASPGDVGAQTGVSADAIADRGSAAVLAQLALEPALRDDWVLDELARGWATYDDDALEAALRAAAVSTAPTLDELSRITTPCAVVALEDDPLHPASVARAWADAIPSARLAVLARDAPALDRGALGEAARIALERLSGSR